MTADLVRLEQAERMLAEVASAEDAIAVADLAEAARVFAKKAKLGTRAINHATLVKLSAERKLAGFVDEGQAAGQIATQKTHGRSRNSTRSQNTVPAALADIGVKSRQVAEARAVRDTFTEAEIAERVEAANAADKELSRQRLLRIARDRRAAKKRDAEAAKHTPAEHPRAVLRLGDFREVLADLTGVDAIITDPPYPRAFLPMLRDLALWSDRVLTPDGVLVVLMGQTWLPDVYQLLHGGRPYRWTGCYLTSGPSYVSHPRAAASNWKPFIVYGGSRRFADVVRVQSAGSDAAKTLHEWGQDDAAFRTLVERFTHPGQLVCDPFAGSGTALLAAINTGRRAVGAELDPEHHAAAVRRLA